MRVCIHLCFCLLEPTHEKRQGDKWNVLGLCVLDFVACLLVACLLDFVSARPIVSSKRAIAPLFSYMRAAPQVLRPSSTVKSNRKRTSPSTCFSRSLPAQLPTLRCECLRFRLLRYTPNAITEFEISERETKTKAQNNKQRTGAEHC